MCHSWLCVGRRMSPIRSGCPLNSASISLVGHQPLWPYSQMRKRSCASPFIKAQSDLSGLAPCPQRGGPGVVDDLRPADQAKEEPKANSPPAIVRVDLGNTLPWAVFVAGIRSRSGPCTSFHHLRCANLDGAALLLGPIRHFLVPIHADQRHVSAEVLDRITDHLRDARNHIRARDAHDLVVDIQGATCQWFTPAGCKSQIVRWTCLVISAPATGFRGSPPPACWPPASRRPRRRGPMRRHHRPSVRGRGGRP